MKNKSLLTLLALVAGTVFAQAADEESTNHQVYAPINTGAAFLSVAPDARGGGMGDVGVGTTPDANSQYWNPSKYAFMNGVGGASISYVPWLRKIVNDIDLITASGYYRIHDVQAVSMSFRFLSVGQVLMTTGPEDPGMEYKPYDLAVDAAYSRILSKHFSMGVALRFIYSDLTGGFTAEGSEYTEPGWAIGADISGYYGHKIAFGWGDGFGSFGFNISNIGSKIEYGDYMNSAFLPTNLRLGGSFTLPFDKYNHMSFNLDVNKLLVPGRPIENTELETHEEYSARLEDYYKMSPITGIFKSFADMPDGSKYNFASQIEKVMFSLGLEYDYDKRFFGRMGYFNESKTQGNRKYVTFGAGFKLNVFELDVAYVLSVTKNNPLDQTLRFTLGFNMGGLKELAGSNED